MTTAPPDPRIVAILQALDALPPDALEAAARLTPGDAGRVLGALVLAMRAPDRAAQVRAIVEKDLGSVEALARLFGGTAAKAGTAPAGSGPAGSGPAASGPVGAAVRGQLARLDAELAHAQDLAAAIGQVRGTLAETLEPALAAVADDPELSALAGTAFAELRDDQAVKLAADVAANARTLRDQLAAAAAVRPGPAAAQQLDLAALPALVARLEADATRAQSLAAGLQSRVVPALQQLAELARARGHASAADLTAAEAALTARLAGPTDPTARTLWRRALDIALASGNLRVAWSAGKHVQVEALDIGDAKLATVVAHRVADLARAQGDVARELVARMEEALLLVRLPGYVDQGRSMAEDMLARVESAPPAVRARVLLMAGQLYEQLGDEPRARTLFRRILRAGKGDTTFRAELGRAALHLGRLEQRAGQPAQGRQDLRLAYEIAAALGDVRLYLEAVPALVEALADAGKDPDIATVVREAAGRFVALGQGDAFRAELEQRWGAERVARWWG